MSLSNMFLSSLNFNTTMSGDTGVKQAAVSKDSSKRTSFEEEFSRKQKDYSRKTTDINESYSKKNDYRDKPRDIRRDDEREANSVDNAVNDNSAKPKEINEPKPKEETKIKETAKTDENNSELDVTDEKQSLAISLLAQNLGIPEETIKQTLEQMNLSPESLTDTKNMKDFIQILKGIEDPVELLNLSDLRHIMDTIKNTLKNLDVNFSQNNILQQQNPNDAKAIANLPTQEATETVALTDKTATQEVVKTVKQADEAIENTDLSEAPTVEHSVGAGAATANTSGFAGSSQHRENTNQGNFTQTETKINNNLINEQTTFNPQTQKTDSTQSATPLSRAQTVNILNQISENIKMNIKFDTKELSMNLKPEALGNITLKLLTTDGKITAQFIAENTNVKETIEGNLNTLKNSLKEQGVNVESITVEVRQENTEQEQMRYFQNEQQKSEGRAKRILEREGFLTEEQELVETETQYDNPYSMSYSNVEYTA